MPVVFLYLTFKAFLSFVSIYLIRMVGGPKLAF